MLTGIVKATRAHYAALQHRLAPDRIAIDYEVSGVNESGWKVALSCGTIWVRAWNNVYHPGRRQAEMTKLVNRLRAMYPEAREIRAAYRKPIIVGPGAYAEAKKRALEARKIPSDCACGATYDDQTHKSWCTNG
jgi:hypothetical protein